MSKIKVLPGNLANKIAAGEVVERPASVVKELVENAIDAGSRRIFISLSEGGIHLIQVQDDGEGMGREDALLAFQRHATSKVVEEEDLTSIRTLGFRGEALPSIGSISRVRLATQTDGSEEGTEVLVEGGEIRQVRSIGIPRGSLFEVRDLFYNTPARKKFLKSSQTEISHVSDRVFQLALSHPTIHFRLSHDKKILLDCPSVQNFRDRILQLFEEACLQECIEAHGTIPLRPEIQSRPEAQSIPSLEKILSVELYSSRPPLRRGHRRDQYIFVNRRPVKSPFLSRAIYDAYGSYLMKGENPFFILFLSIDPAWVDVNVHPTKREVRFQNAGQVYQTVREGVQNALASAGMTESDAAPPIFTAGPQSASARWVGWPETVAEKRPLYPSSDLRPEMHLRPEIQSTPGISSYDSTPSLSYTGIPLIRPLGQIYGTFLLAEMDGEFTIVDQHAAHERVLYEMFLQRQQGKISLEIQPLLVPQQIDLPLQRAGILKDYLKSLEELGWKIEIFGETTFLIREIPALVFKMNLESFLLDLTEELAHFDMAPQADQPIFKMITSMACHGAVRAHQPLTSPEIETLLKDYFQMKAPPTCPHGRPILLRYPLSELEKLFRRK